MHPVVSIIVPVYNVEKYLEECVRSICNQTYTDLEIILVDDGSKDRSGEICDRLMAEDPRIKVVHQPNGGSNSARRTGLQQATGDFIGFVDSDDTIQPDYVDTLMSHFDDTVDLVSSHILVGKVDKIEKFDRRQFVSKILKREISWNLCGKIYRRDIVTDDDFDIPKLGAGDDFVLNLRFAKNIKNQTVFLPLSKYNYRVNDASLMSSFARSLDYEMTVINSVRQAVERIGGDFQEPLLHYEIGMLGGFIAHRLPVDYKGEWVKSVVERGKKCHLSTAQKRILQCVDHPVLRLFPQGMKMAKTLVKRMLMRKGSR